MTLSLALVAKGFYQGAFSGYYMLICLMGFIAFFAISLGAVIWVLISEVFPNNVRSKGASIRQHDTLGVVRPPFMDVSRFHPYRRYLHFQFLCHYDVPKLLLCSQATRNKEQVSGADTKGIDQLTTYE